MASIKQSDMPTAAGATVAADPAEANVKVIEAVEASDKAGDVKSKEDKNEGKDNQEKASIMNYFRVLSYGTTLDWLLMGVSLFTSIGAGIALPLMNVVFGNLVGDFTNYFTPNTTVTRHQFQSSVNKNALYFVYLFVAKLAMSYISMLTLRISGLRISAALRLAYLRALFAQPVSTVDTISPGKVSSRITTSSNTVQLAISQQLSLLVQALSLTIALYVVAFVKNWLLTFVASACLPFIVVAYGVVVPFFLKYNKVTEFHLEQASALVFEIFSSIRIVQAFGAEDKLAAQHEKDMLKARMNDKKNAPFLGLMLFPSNAAMYGTFGLTFWFGIRHYGNNLGSIVTVLFSVMLAVMSIGRIAAPVIAIVKAASAATELFVTIDAQVPDTSGLRDPDVSSDADIRFDSVSFNYPSRPDVQILDGLNVQFEAGKVSAIVGPSGSGKSTIVALLERWYDIPDEMASSQNSETASITDKPTQDTSEKPSESDAKKDDKTSPRPNTGVISVGGTNILQVDRRWWRSQIGLVQQEPFLFNDTIHKNVAFGLSGTKWEEATKEEKLDMVIEACKEAYADEFISKLPDGYDTLVGEGGVKLSGGQKQRLAIARSIIKKPPILILDEATSSIDVRTERIVQAALDRVSQDRTTIVIAHRLSTIKRADKIVVLRKGKLVEQGTHEQLLEHEDGVYHGLVRAQQLSMEQEENIEEDISLQKTKTDVTDRSGTDPEDTRHTAPSDEKAVYKTRGLFRGFGLLLYEQRSHRVLYSMTILGALGGGVVYPLQAYIFAHIINIFTYTGSKFISEGNFWSGMFAIEALGVSIAYFILGWSSHIISMVVSTVYRQEYLVNILKKRIPFFDQEDHSVGSLTSSVSNDATQLQQLLGTEMCMGLIAVVNIIGSVAISFVYGWKLTLVSLFAALPPIIVAGYLRVALERKFEEMNVKVFSESAQFASEAVGAFRTVTALIMEDMIADRYQNLLQGHVSKAFTTARFSTIVFAISDSVELACMGLAFWYGGTLLASREYQLIDFFIIYMGVIQGAVAAGTFFAFAPNIAQASSAASRILSMRSVNKEDNSKLVHLKQTEGGVGVEFKNVYFTYKTREVPVLTGLNIKIQPGQFAALVGASGCGKSTTISLLERFYDADSGSILCGDQDITSVSVSEYRKNISLVSQEPTLYEGTIRDNVALSVDTAEDAAIEQACADAQIHEFIISLPDGYNTRLGPKGMSLSGGQKQRLSLARALLRKPKLLLLDEATSSLDSESEKQVQAAIERAAADDGKTVIAVAHRLATIQKADVIFVLGSGRVLEHGDHQSLLRKKGMYYQMCQAQALDR